MFLLQLLMFQVGGGLYAATLDGDYTLSTTYAAESPHVLEFDAGGSNRNVNLPAAGRETMGLWYLLANSGTSGNLVLKNGEGGSTALTLLPGEAGLVVCKDASGTVSWDGFKLKDRTFSSGLSTDTISESTSAAGVTVDGVKLKDSEVYTDQILEKTSGSGVTIDGVLLKDSQVKTDTILEKTSAAGVTIDGLLVKDNAVGSASAPAAGVTATQVVTDTLAEKTVGSGVTVDGCLVKDGRAAALATEAQKTSAEQTGTGASQTVAHQIGAVPSTYFVVWTDIPAGGCAVSAMSVDATNVTLTVTAGAKFRIVAFK